jgi:hypothetical protein
MDTKEADSRATSGERTNGVRCSCPCECVRVVCPFPRSPLSVPPPSPPLLLLLVPARSIDRHPLHTHAHDSGEDRVHVFPHVFPIALGLTEARAQGNGSTAPHPPPVLWPETVAPVRRRASSHTTCDQSFCKLSL